MKTGLRSMPDRGRCLADECSCLGDVGGQGRGRTLNERQASRAERECGGTWQDVKWDAGEQLCDESLIRSEESQEAALHENGHEQCPVVGL